jgi:hypothetical protein
MSYRTSTRDGKLPTAQRTPPAMLSVARHRNQSVAVPRHRGVAAEESGVGPSADVADEFEAYIRTLNAVHRQASLQ